MIFFKVCSQNGQKGFEICEKVKIGKKIIYLWFMDRDVHNIEAGK